MLVEKELALEIATRFNLKNDAKLTSVSYFISSSTLNTGVEIKSKVWGF